NLQRTRHPDEIDGVVGHAVTLQAVERTGDELIDDELIEPRRDDDEAAGRCGEGAFVDDGHEQDLSFCSSQTRIGWFWVRHGCQCSRTSATSFPTASVPRAQTTPNSTARPNKGNQDQGEEEADPDPRL